MNEEILIVEDEKVVARDIENKLNDIGYSVAGIVDRGEAAVEKVEDEGADAVLMDIKLKGEMDGIQAAEQIKEMSVPVVYLTAYADEELLERAKETEPFGYIVKPFSEQDLNIELKMALYKHRMERRLEESRERYRTLFDNTGIPMFLMDDDKEITLMNEEFQRKIGGLEGELEEGMVFTDLMGEGDEKRLEKYLYLLEIEDEDTPKNIELELSGLPGGEGSRTMFSTIKSMPGTDEKIVSLIDVSQYDAMIDDLKRVEELFEMGFDWDDDLTFPTDLNNLFGQDYFEEVKDCCLNELLLLLIGIRGEASGSQLLSDINTMFGTSLNPSMMYPRLRKMKDDGLLQMREKQKTKEYSLSERKECIDQIKDRIEDLFKVNIVLKFFLDRARGD